jgi:hypothetical protein
MKTFFAYIITSSLSCGIALAVETTSYSNFIRQFQMPSQVVWDSSASVAANGAQLSDLAINPGGARFELWTMKSSSLTGLTEYLLDSSYVGTYIPLASIEIRSEDGSSAIPRTRADRPYYVDVTIDGLRAGATDPVASKSVKFLRHVQSYGINGNGIGINRSQAQLLSQSSITENGTKNLTYSVTMIPGDDRSKICGEERYSVFSLEDYQSPESQLASKYIQIWPVAEGFISPIYQNQVVRYSLPELTLSLKNLYPNSTTYAQVYKGESRLGVTGAILPGSALVTNDSVPQSRTLTLSNYDSLFDSDGRWTIELVTVTPFGMERMRTPSGAPASITFELDRSIEVNASVTTIE